MLKSPIREDIENLKLKMVCVRNLLREFSTFDVWSYPHLNNLFLNRYIQAKNLIESLHKIVI